MSRYDGKPKFIVDLGEPRPHPSRDWKNGTPDGCAYCGQPHMKCAGHWKTSKQPCNFQAMRGQTKCRMHGGKSEQAMAIAKKRILKAEGIHDLECLGFPVGPTTPVDALQASLNEAERNVINLRVMVAGLRSLVIQETDKFGGKKLVAHPLWLMYERERDRYAGLSIAAQKVGFEGALVRIKDAEAKQLAWVLDRVLLRAGLNPEAADVRSWVAAELEAADEAA